MNKFKLLTIATVLTFQMVAFAEIKKPGERPVQLTSGDIGNETVRPDGRPNSTATKPCEERPSWQEFETKMRIRPGYDKFMSQFRAFYPPLYFKLQGVAKEIVICETKNDINRTLPNVASTEPRMALWLAKAEGDKNLLMIHIPSFYSKKVTDAERAATVVRELSHPIFYEIYKDAQQTDWMKHNLIYYMHETFTTNAGYDALLEMFINYKLIRGDGMVVCAESLSDCLRTYDVLVALTDPASPLSAIRSIKSEISVETLHFILSKLSSPQVNAYGAGPIKDALIGQMGYVTTVEKAIAVESLLFSNLSNGKKDLLDSLSTATVAAASRFWLKGDVDGADALIQLLKSQNFDLKQIKSYAYYDVGVLRLFRKYEMDAAVEITMNTIVGGYIGRHAVAEFKSFADEFGPLFTESVVAKNISLAFHSLEVRARMFGYLVEKGFITRDIKANLGKGTLKKLLREYPETKHLAKLLK